MTITDKLHKFYATRNLAALALLGGIVMFFAGDLMKQKLTHSEEILSMVISTPLTGLVFVIVGSLLYKIDKLETKIKFLEQQVLPTKE